MVIRKQPIISWLLDENYKFDLNRITIPKTSNKNHVGYLSNALFSLYDIQKSSQNWGLPELLMPSFKKMMEKSAKSFFDMDHRLFNEFYEDYECGILLDKNFGTIVYGFGENKLYVWLFKTENDISVLYNYFYIESKPNNLRKLYCSPTLLYDSEIYISESKARDEVYEVVGNLLITYLAVKKYAKVETLFIPNRTVKIIEDKIDGYKYKDQIKNESGQEVIVMDSRWFVKIINDNNIFVRGFFRLQNKKNELGEWYKELIFVDSHIRHGYHRNAKIEENNNE